MRISSRLLLHFLVVAVLPLSLFSYFNLRQNEETLRAEALSSMSNLADKKSMQVRDYLSERMQDTRLLARSPQVIAAIASLTARGSSPNQEEALIRPFFDNYVEGSGIFYDLFLITPAGNIVYTQKHESDFASNLLTGPEKNSPLAAAFRDSRMTLEPVISSYSIYSPSNAPALFIAAPIVNDGKFIGVFAIQISNQLFYQVATDSTGLGKSGEVSFSQKDGDGMLFTTPLKYHPDAAMKLRLNLQQMKRSPMFGALAGTSGEGVQPDYRGIPVVAAWRYLPELNWGMVVKVDADEVFAPIERQRKIMLQAMLGLLLFSGLTAYFFGRMISKPLDELVKIALEAARGNLNKRADESAPGEVGMFARAFNDMSEKLQKFYLTLEDRVEERTRELHVSNEQLEEEIIERTHVEWNLKRTNDELAIYKRFIDASSNAMGISGLDGRITYGNPALCELYGIAAESLTGHFLHEFHALDGMGIPSGEILRTVMAQGSWKGELRINNLLGQAHDTLYELHLLRDSVGKPYALANVIVDITERKRAEMLLRRHKVAIDTVHDGFWLTDARGFLLEANQAYAAMSGYDVNELPGMHISQLEAAEQSQAEVEAHIARVIERGFDVFETRHRHKDGHEIDVEVSTSFIEQSQQFVVFTRDISGRKQTEAALQISKQQYERLAANIPVGVYLLHSTSEGIFSFQYVSPRFCSLLGVDAEEVYLHARQAFAAIHPDDSDEFTRRNRQAFMRGEDFLWEGRLSLAGQIRWIRIESKPEPQSNGDCIWDGMITDITTQKLAADKLRVAAVTFETHEGIMITDADSNIIRVNRAFQDITGYSSEDVLGKNPRILHSGRQSREFYQEMWGKLLADGTWSGEIWDRRKNGEIYPKWLTITAVRDDTGKTSEYVAIFSDITARKRAEEEIRNLAFYDALTGLPNRRLLLDRFHLALALSLRSHHCGALLFLDMDKFKTLNDTLGHDYGDLMLIEVAQRIQACVRECDTVARLGGDEFVVLIEEISENMEDASQKVALIAEKIRHALAQPYLLKNNIYHSSPSIGVSMYRGSSESVDVLMKHADMAMYQAKDAGRNAVRFFDPLMQQAVETRAALETDLRGALPNNQMQLYYQIQVDEFNRPIGAEALIRWLHPERGMVSPIRFIPIAEESALILDIGYWVIETACRQLARWASDDNLRFLVLAVNVSAQQFRQKEFVPQLKELVQRHGVHPERLKLELTESVVLNNVAEVVEKMHALKALGIQMSLDDFGTGYSSLSYLKQLPLDQLKIDQSFVRDMNTDPNDAVMVVTIIDLAKNFRLNVIAEGVENEAQLALLRKNGCTAFQGYLFGKPLPLAEFEKMIPARE